VTIAALAKLLCLVSGLFGRPAWEDARCLDRADAIMGAAGRHGIDPVLMVAVDVVECDLGDRDAPIREDGRLVGYDACPMGVRLRGVTRRADYDEAALYELGAARLEAAKKRWKARRRRGHFVAAYNWGNREYAADVLAVAAALRGRRPRTAGLADRIAEIVRRISAALSRKES